VIVYGNRMLRGILGPERDEVAGGWRKLCNESFIICTLYQGVLGSSNKEKEIGRTCNCTWEMRKAYKISVRKLGDETAGRHRHRLED
jgi:hypothetical protein